MKKITILVTVFVALIGVIACTSDFEVDWSFTDNSKAEAIAEAKLWYESNKPGDMVTVRAIEEEKISVIPYWDAAFAKQNEDYKVVETTFTWERYVAYFTQDCYEAYLETKDARYIDSKTRLVVRTDKKSGMTDACVMIIMPSKKYIEETDFKPYKKVSFLNREGFDGRIAFVSLTGDFLEGMVYSDGEIVNSFTMLYVPFVATKCYEKVYAGQDCHYEPIYETITTEEWVWDSNSEGHYETVEYQIKVGEQEVCKNVYEEKWNPNCGKNHDRP